MANCSKFCKLLAAMLLACLITNCTPKAVEVSSVSLNTSTIEMVEGDTYSLVATVLPSNAEYDGINWASSNLSVVSVTQGTVTALKAGTATVTASAGGKSATCSVTVSQKIIPVTLLVLDRETLSMHVGDSQTLTATVKPDDATEKTVIWTSSNESVATVKDGTVKAIASGTATVSAECGGLKAECIITVTVPVSGITLDRTELSLAVGENYTLTASVKPDDAADKNVKWTTSDASVASVEGGKVTALKKGTASITAECAGKKAECKVTVTVPVSGITLDRTSASLKVGETVTLSATVKPDDATDKTVTWTSSNESVATVKDGTVKALKGGCTIITAECGGKKAECSVTVIVPVTSITLDKSELSIFIGSSKELHVTFYPADATEKSVIWESSNPNVATVDDSGKVKAISRGVAIITVNSGNCSASCEVTVKGDEDIDLNKEVWMELKGTSISITNGAIYYGRTYKIHNDSPVDIRLVEIGTTNFHS